jgi:hypothetical protein
MLIGFLFLIGIRATTIAFELIGNTGQEQVKVEYTTNPSNTPIPVTDWEMRTLSMLPTGVFFTASDIKTVQITFLNDKYNTTTLCLTCRHSKWTVKELFVSKSVSQ